MSTVCQFVLLCSNISFEILGLPMNGILNEIFSTIQLQQLPVGLMQDSTLHTQSKPSVPLRRSSWFLPNETGTGAHLPLTHLLLTKATFWGRIWHLYIRLNCHMGVGVCRDFVMPEMAFINKQYDQSGLKWITDAESLLSWTIHIYMKNVIE